MNILFLTQRDPRCASTGAEQRTHVLWRALGQIGTVYTVVTSGEHTDTIVPEERIKFSHLRSSSSIVWFIQRAVVRLGCGVCWPFRSGRFIRRQIAWEGVIFDCVVTRYIRVAADAAAWKLAPCYVDIDDLPVDAYRANMGVHHVWVRRLLSMVSVKGWTRYVLRHCAGAWLPNPDQIDCVRLFCPCGYLPNLALPPSDTYNPSGSQQPLLFTIGLMSYEPNIEGVDWFISAVWPKVHARYPALHYAVAGKGLPEAYRMRWEQVPGVQVLGFVKDLEATYASALAVVTPIRSGAGTCIKVLEAAAYGRRDFATPFALRGLSAQEIEEMGASVFDDADRFLEDLGRWITLPLEDRAREQQRIAQKGRYYTSEDRVRDCIVQLFADTGLHL